MPSSSSPAPDVRADTRYRSACPPALTTAWSRAAASPRRRARRGSRRATVRSRHPARRGQRRDLLAGDQAVQRFALRRRAGLGDGAAHHERVQEGLDHQAAPAPRTPRRCRNRRRPSRRRARRTTRRWRPARHSGARIPGYGRARRRRCGGAWRCRTARRQSAAACRTACGGLRCAQNSWPASQSQDHLGDDVFWISLEPPKIDSLRLLKYCAEAVSAPSGPMGVSAPCSVRRRRPGHKDPWRGGSAR